MEERGGKNGNKQRKELKSSFATGVIALVFLLIGYQAALFMHRTAVLKILGNRDRPDTVYVMNAAFAEKILSDAGISDLAVDTFKYKKVHGGKSVAIVKEAPHKPQVQAVREKYAERKVETFRFDPNEIPVEGLVRLGFSQKQAESIDNYRRKGGRFRRKGDFAKSFVVSDSVYRRLEPYIDIPLVDLNKADSAGFDNLPGIGGYYAAAMLKYKESLGGSFSYKEQLLDIRGFDMERYEGLSDLITVADDGIMPYPLWSLPEDSLKQHPYIGAYAAHGVVLFRENNPREQWTVDALDAAGILKPGMAAKLSRCRIAPPE